MDLRRLRSRTKVYAVVSHGWVVCREDLNLVVDSLLNPLDCWRQKRSAYLVRYVKSSKQHWDTETPGQPKCLQPVSWHRIQYDGVKVVFAEQSSEHRNHGYRSEDPVYPWNSNLERPCQLDSCVPMDASLDCLKSWGVRFRPESSILIKFQEGDFVPPQRQELGKLMHLEDDFLAIANLVNEQYLQQSA